MTGDPVAFTASIAGDVGGTPVLCAHALDAHARKSTDANRARIAPDYALRPILLA